MVQDEIETLVFLVESLFQQNERLKIEKHDFDRQSNIGHASYWGEKQTLNALARRDGILSAIRRCCENLARQSLPYEDTWPVRKIFQYVGEEDEGLKALRTHWPELRRELLQLAVDNLPEHDPGPPTVGVETADIPEQGFTPGALAKILRVSDSTIRRRAKAAMVTSPMPGQKGKPYALVDVRKILLQIISTSPRDCGTAADLLNRVNGMIATMKNKAGQDP